VWVVEPIGIYGGQEGQTATMFQQWNWWSDVCLLQLSWNFPSSRIISILICRSDYSGHLFCNSKIHNSDYLMLCKLSAIPKKEIWIMWCFATWINFNHSFTISLWFHELDMVIYF
jgi:hypothetical protein